MTTNTTEKLRERHHHLALLMMNFVEAVRDGRDDWADKNLETVRQAILALPALTQAEPHEALERFKRAATYPVSTDIKERGYAWRSDKDLDFALSELTQALSAPPQDAGLREALERLANAADEVGVEYFDTDTMDDTVSEMQSATIAARQALSVSPWREDMENAPRDGTHFLGWWPERHPNDRRTVTVFANHDELEWTDSADSIDFDMDGQPTHWMPLPQPPATKD